jgi:hypothetical protein
VWGINAFSQNLTVSGKIADQKNMPIDAAEVLLLLDNQVITSELTDVTGDFVFKNLVPDAYSFLVKQLRDTLYSQNINLTQSLDLGTITVKYTSRQLEEVIITEQKKLIERKGDRLILNVENSMFTTGTSAIEILKNVPKIDPSSETLKIIGKSNVLVMVNDRLLNLEGRDLENYLKTLRSENIAKIELMTNPPAKFDAAGNSGLINIVLKKNTNIGLDGSVTGTYVQRTKAGYMPSGNLTYSTDKLSVGLNLFADKEIRTADSDIDVIFSDLTRKSKVYREDNSKGFSSNLNVDYTFKKSNIGMIINTDWWNIEQLTASKVRFVNNSNQIDSTQNLPSNDRNKYNYFSISPYYDLKLDTLGKKMKLNYNYLERDYNYSGDFTSQNYSGNFDRFIAQTSAVNRSKSNYKVNTLNIDFELPFKRYKIETGVKYSYFNNNSDIKFYDTSGGNPDLDENQSNQFIYHENIYAAYFSIEKQWNDQFFTKAGLRYETTKTKGNSVTTDTLFMNNFYDFFPSIFISYNPNENNSFSLGYNKRIDRPVFYDVNPFRTYIDFYNYSEGNPQLEPSKTHNIEISYILKSNFSLTVYFSLLKNGSDYITMAQMNNPIIISTPKNFFEQKTFGLDISYNWNITKKLSSYNSYSCYHNNSESTIPELTTAYNKGYGSFISSRNSYKIGENYRIYLNYYYEFPSTNGFWKTQHSSYSTLGGMFIFPKQNFNINLSFSDILKTSGTKGIQEYPNFIWKSNIYNDNRNVKISLTYKFGNSKSKSVDRQIDDSDKSRLSK